MLLVTGGAGFIGSNVVAGLNESGRTDVVVSDTLGPSGKWRNLQKRQLADFVPPSDLARWLEGRKIDAVIHLGAISATTASDGDLVINSNFRLSLRLLDWCTATRTRFIYASSAATYGDGSQGMDESESGINRLRPLNAYGFSKQLFDLHARRRGYLGQIVGLKYFNVFGPNEAHKGEMRSLVSKAFYQLQQTGKIQLFKSYKPEFRDGEQKRDFLYVKDAVDMTIHLAIRQSTAGLFNLGSGQARTWIDLATAVFSALGKKPEIEFIEMPDVLRGKYQYFTQANTAKLMATGYKGPRYSLDAAVADYVQNYLVPDKNLEVL